MDKVSGYVVANGQGGYDVIAKTSQTCCCNKPFTIPAQEIPSEKTTQTTLANTKDYTYTEYDPFKNIAETGNFEVPGYIHTKTKPTRSDEEILKEIEELAKEYARTGQDRNNDQRFLKLMDEYLSSVSPDRAGILKQSVPEISGIVSGIFGTNSQDYSMSDIFQQIDSQRTDKTDEEDKKKNEELIDYLLEMLKNKGKDNHVSIDIWESLYEGDNGEIIETRNAMIKSDMYDGFVQDGVIQYVNFFDPNNKIKDNELRLEDSIMSYSSGKLTQQLTQEEASRKKEVYAAYNAAYDFACGKKDLQTKDRSETYKEAYNSTYERLTNSSVA